MFDSQLTTYTNLRRLEKQDIRFLTLPRRTRKLLAAIYARPNSAWRRITLRSLTRSYRTPRVFDERIAPRAMGDLIPHCARPLRSDGSCLPNRRKADS